MWLHVGTVDIGNRAALDGKFLQQLFTVFEQFLRRETGRKRGSGKILPHADCASAVQK